ncbi:FAD:protein FMN transferase [Paenibacillus filicis]|uniref:FAD:protein FMN transferase n=1 Tax=Paenibacillus gyeongsangnamensis TaxID=3388067 RepID=A0ABT4QFH5_9BACL|nr:FAD:protein FMN transferase [Paenibacillus filicis]MCZ8515611.1 FAD:protein FMN transferase [Paenibacillus filicis]
MRTRGEEAYASVRFRAMNTDVDVVLDASAGGLAAEAQSWFEFAERIFSRFRKDSELSCLNASGGRPCFVSKTMMAVLQLAEDYRVRTEGIYEPFVLPALEQAGYDVSFERLKSAAGTRLRLPMPKLKLKPKPPTAAQTALTLDPRMGIVRLPEGGRLDLGGLVKGWTVDRLASWFSGAGAAAGLINAGGDLRAWGGTQISPWTVEVADPWEPERTLAKLRLIEGAAATSSVIGRRWSTDEGERHHLIDPRTMRPVRTDVAQCTVAGRTAGESEIAAKTVCILGLREGLEWLGRQGPRYQALLITKDGLRHYYGTEAQWLEQWQGERPDAVTLRPASSDSPDNESEGGLTYGRITD